MKRPEYDSSVNPFNVWLITKWSNIKRAKCHTELNRKVDIQYLNRCFVRGQPQKGAWFLCLKRYS